LPGGRGRVGPGRRAGDIFNIGGSVPFSRRGNCLGAGNPILSRLGQPSAFADCGASLPPPYVILFGQALLPRHMFVRAQIRWAAHVAGAFKGNWFLSIIVSRAGG